MNRKNINFLVLHGHKVFLAILLLCATAAGVGVLSRLTRGPKLAHAAQAEEKFAVMRTDAEWQ